MSWNRVEYKEQGRVLADAENAQRWTAFQVNAQFALVFDRGWRRILDADPLYRYTRLVVTPDSDGLVPLTTLTAAITPSQFHRVFDKRLILNSTLIDQSAEVVWNPSVIGSSVKYPVATAGTSLACWFNHWPENPQSYTTTPDAQAVNWPTGYELVLAYHLAAMLLSKGALEVGASAALLSYVDDLYTDMLQTLMRRTTAPATMGAPDDAASWSAGMNW